MQIAIFIFYIILFTILVTKLSFFNKSGIGKYTLPALFFIKVLVGIVYAKFYTLPKYYATSDTWRFFRYSVTETKWLLRDPIAFIKDLFSYNYSKSGNLFSGKNTYWNDLKSNVVIKMMALFNTFTNNSYYADIIFFNFLFLFGLVALFRLFYCIYPQKKWLIIAGIFLLPSTLFWCSGIHKDGLILSATGIVIYKSYEGLKGKFTISSILVILLCMLVIFSLRNYVLFALIPPLFAWSLCRKYVGREINVFSFIYLSLLILCLIVFLIFPSINILLFISGKQHEFLLLEGGSKVSVPVLQPTIASFISYIPFAFDMAFLRPHVSEFKSLTYLPAILENLLFLLLIFVSIINYSKIARLPAVILFLFFFSISIMLLTGYTIPFTGAIVRYRSLVLPLLITPLLCMNNFAYPTLGRINR